AKGNQGGTRAPRGFVRCDGKKPARLASHRPGDGWSAGSTSEKTLRQGAEGTGNASGQDRGAREGAGRAHGQTGRSDILQKGSRQIFRGEEAPRDRGKGTRGRVRALGRAGGRPGRLNIS